MFRIRKICITHRGCKQLNGSGEDSLADEVQAVLSNCSSAASLSFFTECRDGWILKVDIFQRVNSIRSNVVLIILIDGNFLK